MIVSSATLTAGAATVRKRKRPQTIHAEGVTVTAAQLDTAARILREADPSIANGIKTERPGFIERRSQGDPEVLVFRMGILPSTEYRIDRRGSVLSITPDWQQERPHEL
jgi:hypothetical protein